MKWGMPAVATMAPRSPQFFAGPSFFPIPMPPAYVPSISTTVTSRPATLRVVRLAFFAASGSN
jgi:hypothetical protein